MDKKDKNKEKLIEQALEIVSADKKDKVSTKDNKSKNMEDAKRLVRNQMLKEKAVSLFTSSSLSRAQYDWQWMTRDLFRRGYQFSSYDAKSRTVLVSSKSSVKFPINLLWAQMRIVKNQVTNFRPKWEVLPQTNAKESSVNAKYSGSLLDYYYQRLNLRKMIKETVMQGLIFSVGGPWQIGYDPDGDNGKGEVTVWLLDPYDFYVDPNARSVSEAEYCIKAVRKGLSDITSNPRYNFFGDVPDKGEPALAASPSKQFILQSLKHIDQNLQEEEQEGFILKEAWIKTRVTQENMEELKSELAENDEDNTNLREGEVLMRVVHYIDSQEQPLLVQLCRRSDFPFVIYQADINPCELYGESWSKHIIPINKVLNALESSVFTYNYKYAIGRLVVDKNSGVRMITNQHGDIVEKNAGSTVTSLPLQPLPNSYDSQIANCRRYIEDLGGAHDISMGRLPPGINSGIAIAELKQADSSNQSDLVDNLEEFLVEVGQKILREIAKNYTVPKVAKDLGMFDNIGHFAYIGEAGKNRKNSRSVRIGVDQYDLAVIGSDNEIRVTIGSWLAYTKTARQERIKELFNAGLIDQKTALRYLEFGDIDTIIENVRKEELLKEYRTKVAAGAGEAQVSDEDIARQENNMMTNENRQIDPLVTDNHVVHWIIHQEAMGLSGNKYLEDHMNMHWELAQKNPNGQPNNAQTMMEGRATGPEMVMPESQSTVPLEAGPVAPQSPSTGSPEEMALMQSMAEAGGMQ